MFEPVMMGKLFLGVALTVASGVVATWRGLHTMDARRFTLLATSALAASRLGLFIALFVILKIEPQSDVVAYYYPQAKHALLGQLPYRDFDSSYAPLFPYIVAAAVKLWDSPKSIVLLAITLEIASLPLWLSVARAATSERIARVGAALYVTNPLPLVSVALNGQNQIACALLLALSLFLVLRRSPALSGLALGASVACVKFLPLLLAPPAFLSAGRHKARWSVAGAAIVVAVYGLFALAGADVFKPARTESALISSGNLPFLLTAAGATSSRGIIGWGALIALVGVLGAIAIWALIRRMGDEPWRLMPLLTLLLLTFMLFSKKSYTAYLCLAFFPVCVTVAQQVRRRAGLFLFGGLSALAMLEPSLWHRWLAPRDLGVLWSSDPGVTKSRAVAFLCCEVALLSGYVIGFWKALTLLQANAPPTDFTQEISPATGETRRPEASTARSAS